MKRTQKVFFPRWLAFPNQNKEYPRRANKKQLHTELPIENVEPVYECSPDKETDNGSRKTEKNIKWKVKWSSNKKVSNV